MKPLRLGAGLAYAHIIGLREIGDGLERTRKRSESIVEDFDSIRRYLNQLENERARSLFAPAVVIEEGKSADWTSILDLWISGKI